MSGRPFTEFVRLLASDGPEISPASLQDLGSALRGALVSELKKRGLWDSSPSYLGVHGWKSWQARPSVSSGAAFRDDPVGELLADCYVFIFVHRRRALQAQLRVKPNIDGLVFLNIRHFLLERQRTHDPLGYRAFEALREAVRTAVEAAELEILGGEPKIKNDTILGRPGGGPPVSGPNLSARVRGWCDGLLPDLVTARGARRRRIIARLSGHLTGLPESGFPAVFFRDLSEPFREEVRLRWAQAFDKDQGEVAFETDGDGPARIVRWVHPVSDLETRDSFEKLLVCVECRLQEIGGSPRTRGYLRTLWSYLSTHADGGVIAKLPSQRRLAAELGIPRERIPGLLRTLGRLVERCQTTPRAMPRDRPRRTLGQPVAQDG